MASLAEELNKLTNPAPTFNDPEDDVDDETSARVVTLTETGHDEDSLEGDVAQFSKLRQQAVPLLAESDTKYQGRKTSRKSFTETNTEDLSGESSDEGEIEESSTKGDQSSSEEDDVDISAFKQQMRLKTSSATKQDSFQFDDDGDYGKYGDSDDMDQGEATDDSEGRSSDENSHKEPRGDASDENTSDSGVEEDEKEDSSADVSKFTKSDIAEEIEKGKAAKNQIGLWDSLLEGRIKLQKSVSLANRLPQADSWPLFQAHGGEEFTESATKCQQAVRTLLESLTQLQTLLLASNPETRHVVDGALPESGSSSKSVDPDDEEITSESEPEDKTAKPTSPKTRHQLKRKLKAEDYPEFLAKRHADFETYRNATIQKWSDKTRLATGRIKSKSFSAFEQSALKQIEQIMADKDRLIRRTQLKRSVYKVLGREDSPDSGDNGDAKIRDTEDDESFSGRPESENQDVEIFDDDDFYHQLLRELIERKTTDISDPIALSRQWLEIQRLRTKVKKKVDTKASKGRKLRYDLHKKLLNFMAPADQSTWTEESRDDLFRSLFGKRFSVTQSETSNR